MPNQTIMSTKSGRPRRSSEPARATPSARSISSAGSPGRTRVDYSVDLAQPVHVTTRRVARQGLLPAQSPRRAVNPPKAPPRTVYAPRRPQNALQALFGAWELPPPQLLTVQRLQAAKTCATRHQRREVLFATRSTGSGSKSPKRHYTNRSCK